MACYFLAFFIFTSCLVAGQSPKYALKGQEVSLMPVNSGRPDQILWKHNGNKVVEFDGKEQAVYSPYENRIALDWVSAELNITDLRFEDSGTYDLETYMLSNKNLHNARFQLVVIDKVAKPTISCEMNDGSSSNIYGRLVCSAEPRLHSLMKFEWSSHGNVQPGPQLTISLGDKHDDEVYSCRVSNPLSSETATFTAKDCYPDNSSSAALIASVVTICIIILLLILGIMLCKLRHKACFAKGKRDDLSPPGTTEGSDKRTAPNDETRPFLDRAPTLPSTQRLPQAQGMDLQNEMPGKGSVKDKIKRFEQKGNADAAQLRKAAEETLPRCDPSHSEKANEPDPADVLGDLSEDTQYDLESSTAPKQPGSEKEADEDEEAQFRPDSAETSPSARPRFPLTKSSPNVAHKNSDLVNEETVRESDSPGSHQKRNESDDSSEEKPSSSVPEQNSSETTLHEPHSNLSQEETHTGEGHQQETDKPVSEDKNESDSVGDSEEKDEEHNLYLATSQQPQSPTPTKPDNRNTNTFQESPDPAHADPDREEDGKTRQDSEGQSDSSTAEADKGYVAGMKKFFENTPESKNEEFKKFPTSPVSKKNAENEGLNDGQSDAPQDEAPEQGSEKEEAKEDEEAQSPPASAETSPTAQPRSPLNKSSSNVAPKDTAGEHKKEPDSDQVNEETVRESDSSGIHQKIK